MQEEGQPLRTGPGVCPFVALVGNRDRRADGPDSDNRCYAEPAPRRRDDRYQEDFCYSPDFSTCPVFLAWADRSAAEPTFVTDVAQKAWGAGIASPEEERASAGDDDSVALPGTPEGGLFGAAGASEAEEQGDDPSTDGFDWVAATAWAEAPYDERAEAEADELAAIEELEVDEAEELEAGEVDDEAGEEATTAPKVPAALPLRKRKRPQKPIRTPGSGEWFYAEPPDRAPLVARRYGVAPSVLLAVLGLLVVALVVFMIPTLFSGDGATGGAAVLPSSDATRRPSRTRSPVVVATPSPAATVDASPVTRRHRVRSGDSLDRIAARFDVKVSQLQCINLIKNKNLIVIGQRLLIPPEGFVCPSRWRQATPAP